MLRALLSRLQLIPKNGSYPNSNRPQGRFFRSCVICDFPEDPHPKSLSQKGRGTLKNSGSPSPALGEGAGG